MGLIFSSAASTLSRIGFPSGLVKYFAKERQTAYKITYDQKRKSKIRLCQGVLRASCHWNVVGILVFWFVRKVNGIEIRYCFQ